MTSSLRIVFMGTPDFAVTSLQRLLGAGCTVVAVITAPDRPSGRGLQLTPSPVKKAALAANIPVLQPERLRDPDFLDELASYKADLQVVVAFRMLPEVVWAMPTVGTLNLHGSLLPQYRGAAPINWAIINGETETGVTTFFIEKEIDTGQLLFSDREPIYPDDTAGTLHDRLMKRGADLVLKTVRAIEANDYTPTPQPHSDDLKPAPKLSRDSTRIDCNHSVHTIRNFVRGLSPYPAAWMMIDDRFFKIYAVSTNEFLDTFRTIVDILPSNPEPGQIWTDGKNYIMIRAIDGWLSVESLQAEGKRRMTAEEFLRGNQLKSERAKE